MRPLRNLTAVMALSLVLATCSSGSDDAPADDTTTTTAGPATTTTQATTTTGATTTTSTTIGPAEGATALVSAIQQQLQALGYFEEPIDGIYGPMTAEVLSEFQADAGITVDGEYGPETYDALANAVQRNAEYVTEVQEGLQELGLYSGRADGQYGSGTKEAVEALQEQCDLEPEVDGRMTPLTHVCLEQALAAA
jgi:peptidoglycan hydrolase-like protein with peptidoglycan-binding domain